MLGLPTSQALHLSLVAAAPASDPTVHLVTPATFAAGLGALQAGHTLVLTDGVYVVDTADESPLILGVANGASTIRAAAGARAIITNSDALPPRVNVLSETTVRGIWFGGTKDPVNKPVVMALDSLMEDCVFFGYYGGINEGEGAGRNTYRGCTFVNCGTGEYYHGIYISSKDAGSVVEDCLFLGGGGYGIQMWHMPTSVNTRRNFFGHCLMSEVINGTGMYVLDSIFWSDVGIAPDRLTLNMSWVTNGEVSHNLFGAATHMVYSENCTNMPIDNNTFVNRSGTGTNQLALTVAAAEALFGHTTAEVDAAISALETALAADATTVHADATVADDLALLAGMVATWVTPA